ncbi:hypothetical protein [Jongsikchunia kroppenstedtii]|uniref:hypothetical protein n=1 Tax=Jongsikchunia kroppenstedtii TaxID=1121721 RepID=UPI0012DE5FCB|nr:hypothetical protein [Jongsikchunia kroppenstedtii]
MTSTTDLAELEAAIETIDRAAVSLMRSGHDAGGYLGGVSNCRMGLDMLKEEDEVEKVRRVEELRRVRRYLETTTSPVTELCPCGWDPADRIRDHGTGTGTPGEFLNTSGEPDYKALDRAIAVIEDFADWQEERPADKTLTAYRRGLGRDLRQFAGRLSVNLKADSEGEAA